ncbi:MAG TPA: MoaD/ThiS family protein [Anaerolineae bacterium]|nr:MoaD/ThiS family protein [Anaerolineae bacterium]
MVVTVRLHATLRRETEQGLQDRLDLELEPGATVASILETLGISADDESVMVVVNRRMVIADQPLADGDEVRLMPAISGGKF